MARKSHFLPPQYANQPGGTVGTISELRVATDLLAKGYEVYRAISSNASVDLIAKKGERTVTVEVRTGREHTNGKLYYKKKNIRAEVLAIACTAAIVYKPDVFSVAT